MTIALLVLTATVVAISAIVAECFGARRALGHCEENVATPAQLDIAIASQRATRRAELERRSRGGNYVPEFMLAVSVLLLALALIEDQFRHPWILSIVFPAIGSVIGARASKKRVARRELERIAREESSASAA